MNFPKNMKLFGTVCSGLLINSLIIPQAVLAQETTSKLNPCPCLLYEEPSALLLYHHTKYGWVWEVKHQHHQY
jgi:hypothetical protein